MKPPDDDPLWVTVERRYADKPKRLARARALREKLAETAERTGWNPDNGALPHYDREGRAISLAAWAVLFEDFRYKRIARSKVPGGWVSTVWLGLDHRYGLLDRGTQAPIIFETMAFWSPSDDCRTMDRYATEAEALAGHRRIVAQLRAEAKTLDATLERSGLPAGLLERRPTVDQP